VTRRYVIVGMGAAGISAAEAIHAADPAGDLLLVSDDAFGYYSRPGLAYYLTGEVPQQMLHPFSDADFRRLGVRRIQARATGLDPTAHRLLVAGGREVGYDRLLLATGSRAFMPSLPGLDLEGVVTLDDLTDARGIVRRARRARAAVVIGGGITALELVEGLRARRPHVHYFLRRDRYWSSVLDEVESRIVEDRLRHEGVQLHYQTELEEVLGRRGRVTAVRTVDGREIACAIVAVAIGVRPRMALPTAAGLEADRGVLVDEYLQSSAPDVFAAGDVAQVYDPLSGKAVLDTLWGVAVAQGRAAGQTMAGSPTAYRKPVPFNVTRLAGLTTTIIGAVGRGRDDADLPGIARGDSETWRDLPDALATQEGFDVNNVRVVVGERTLLGAVVMGDQTLSRALHQLVTHQVDVSSIRPALLAPGAALGDLLARFWVEWRGQNAAS
jgi:NAD(P)H-nitrite reductase large subunit